MIDYYNFNSHNYPMNDSVKIKKYFQISKKMGVFDIDKCIIF